MLWRTLVNQVVREKAQEKINEAVEARSRAAARAAAVASGMETLEEEIPPCDIAFIFALDIESADFVAKLSNVLTTRMPGYTVHEGLYDNRQVVVVDSGVGVDNAARAAIETITLHRPQWVISAGFAGSLHPDVRKGHMVMADHICDAEGRQLGTGLKIDPAAATRSMHLGRLLTVERPVRSPHEKRKLGKAHNAVACDMETMATAAICAKMKTRFISVRVISDGVDEVLPPEVEKLMNSTSLAGKIGAVAGAVLGRPSVVKDLWRLKEDAYRSSDRLAKFLDGVVPQLHTVVIE